MPLYPFTPAGVQDKLDELYALTNTQLAAEAESIKEDFRAWIKSAFILNNDQKDFLDDMNDSAITYYGEQCSLCFLHRLDITLIYPDPPAKPGYAKWPEATNNIVVAADGNGKLTVTGSLTFTMVYEP